MRSSTIPAILAATALGPACDPDCDDPTRLDGHYRVWSNVVTHTPDIEDLSEAYPADAVFYNGLSDWRLKYIPAQAAFEITLDQQAYLASFVQSDENCNAFALDFEGNYAAAGGSSHAFAWSGDLVYFGGHVAGTFHYEADWDVPASGDQEAADGHVTSDGELDARSAGDGADASR